MAALSLSCGRRREAQRVAEPPKNMSWCKDPEEGPYVESLSGTFDHELVTAVCTLILEIT